MSQPSIVSRIHDRVSLQMLLGAKRVVLACRRRRGPCRAAFVAGVQRSGTNMVMDVLERSFETDVYHEHDPRAFDAYQMRPRAHIHALQDASRAPLFVIKSLCELQDLRSLLDEFAPAKALWIVRRYDDVVNSHLAKWTGMQESIGKIARDRNSAAWRGAGMSDATHALVQRLYHAGMNAESSVALFWYFRNILFFEQGLELDPRIMVVRYETLVSAPTSQFKAICEFLDIEFTDHISRKVFASSVNKQRSPAIDDELRRLCDGLARRFDDLVDQSANAVS